MVELVPPRSYENIAKPSLPHARQTQVGVLDKRCELQGDFRDQHRSERNIQHDDEDGAHERRKDNFS